MHLLLFAHMAFRSGFMSKLLGILIGVAGAESEVVGGGGTMVV